MDFMSRVRMALGIDPAEREASQPDRLAHLVKTVHEQSPQWWEVVNESRCRRGEPPLSPRPVFRPSSLIDPRDGR